LIGACGFAVIGACAKSPKVDSVPVGTEVQVTRADGGLVEGTLANRSEKTITIDDGKVPRTIARDDIRLLNVVDASKPAEVPVAARFREIRVPASTPLSVRLETTVSSKSSHEEDPITAVLVEPIVVDGIDVIRTYVWAAANKGTLPRMLSYASFAASAVAIGPWRIRRPDVVIATSPQLLCGAAGFALGPFDQHVGLLHFAG
jgi:hypothetical protein